MSGQPTVQPLLWIQTDTPTPGQPVGAVGSNLLATWGYNDTYTQGIVQVLKFSANGPIVKDQAYINSPSESFDAIWVAQANSKGDCACMVQIDGTWYLLLPVYDGSLTLVRHATSLPGYSSFDHMLVSQDGLELTFHYGGVWYGIDMTNGSTLWSWTPPEGVFRTIVGAPKKDRHIWKNTSSDVDTFSFYSYPDTVTPDHEWNCTFYGLPDLSGYTVLSVELQTAWFYGAPIGFAPSADVPGYALPDWGGSPVASTTLIGSTANFDGYSWYDGLNFELSTPPSSDHTINIQITPTGFSWTLGNTNLIITVDNSSAHGNHYELRNGAQDLIDSLVIDANPETDERWIDSKQGNTVRLRWNGHISTDLHYRVLSSDGDTLAWLDSDVVLTTNWPDGSNLQVSAWDGQLALTPGGGGTST